MESSQILQISTNETEELASFITKNLTPIKKLDPIQKQWQSDFRIYSLNQLFITYGKYPFGISIIPDPTDEFLFLEIPMNNQLKLSSYYPHSSTYIRPHNHCFVVDQPIKILLNDNTIHHTLLIPKKLINLYLRKMNNDELDSKFQLKFGCLLATEEGIAFRRYLTFILEELMRGGQLFKSNTTILEIENTIFSLLISTCKNNNFNLDNQCTSFCHPKYVSRAIDYIEANLTESLSLADLATIAGVHSRTLINSFKKYCNISPMAYVKQKRLEKVHQLLIEAEPTKINVTDIASKYNFLHLGRFAQEYFNLFQELPSETLRDKKIAFRTKKDGSS